MNSPTAEPEPSTRARPLSVEERQASIIDAVIPLLTVHGRDLTSRQIAEAAGVAEGTIFRAFGDKESLIAAAIAKFLDPEPLRLELAGIEPTLTLDEKVLQVVTLLQARFGDIFRIMALVDREHRHREKQRRVYAAVIEKVLAPDLNRLRVPAATVAHIIRLIAFAASLPHLSDGATFTPKELADIVLYGIATPKSSRENQD